MYTKGLRKLEPIYADETLLIVSGSANQRKRRPNPINATLNPEPTTMLSSQTLDTLDRSVLCWLATVDAAGQPNVSPKEIFARFDDAHLVIANIASPTSVRNVLANPRVCVSFIDIFVQKGFKIIGTAHNVARHASDYAQWAAPLLAKAGPRFTIHSVLVVRVESVEPILAPSYRLYPHETTEQSQVDSAMRTYGVQPAT